MNRSEANSVIMQERWDEFRSVPEVKGSTLRRINCNNSDHPIVRFRLSLNLTQQEFADLLGVNKVSIHNWEIGKYKPTMTSQDKMDALAVEYKVARCDWNAFL